MSIEQTKLANDSTDPVIQINGDSIQVREIPGDQYLVINQTNDSQYVVDDTHCTCPSHKYHDGKCKHRRAVEQAENEESEADKIEKIPADPCHSHEVKEIECPDCGGDAVAGQYSRDTYTVHGPNVQRATRILCTECGTIREENDHSSDREI